MTDGNNSNSSICLSPHQPNRMLESFGALLLYQVLNFLFCRLWALLCLFALPRVHSFALWG